MSKTVVIVGIGSNLDPLNHLRSAVMLLKKSFYLKKISNIYESDAQVLPNSPNEWNQKYLNAAVLIEVEKFIPGHFLTVLKSIEKTMGRKDAQRWAPREIDLDILYVHGVEFTSETLNIPHKNLTERPFALLPAIEVFPDIQVQKPIWCQHWHPQIPFNTTKSKNYFWPRFVGIVNLTMDSFSDGGLYMSEESFKNQILKLSKEGAEIIDLGAESTRPEAVGVPTDLEHQRLETSLKWIKELNMDVEVSIDCRNHEVIEKIIHRHQVDYINDVTGFADHRMLDILKNTDARAIVMHSLSVPPNQTETLDQNENPHTQLITWWKNKVFQFEENKINLERFIFDPGIGFGKTPQQNSYILNHLDELSEIENQILLGFSRKSYLRQFSAVPAEQRDIATAIQLTKINPLYCQFLRTHDIESQKTALRMLQ
jgi:2-amino-4-hydroxy-6-hydroxymethyldihydropteridine diphosphokinase/dihydropteroate synthase